MMQQHQYYFQAPETIKEEPRSHSPPTFPFRPFKFGDNQSSVTLEYPYRTAALLKLELKKYPYYIVFEKISPASSPLPPQLSPALQPQIEREATLGCTGAAIGVCDALQKHLDKR